MLEPFIEVPPAPADEPDDIDVGPKYRHRGLLIIGLALLAWLPLLVLAEAAR